MKQATLLSVTTTTGLRRDTKIRTLPTPPTSDTFMAEGGKDKARQGRCPGWRRRGPDSIIASIPVSPLGDLSDFPTGRAGLGARAGGTYHTPSEPYQTNLIECIRPNQGMVRSLNEVARGQGTGARMMTLRRARRPAIGLTGETPPVDTALPFARR